MCREAVAPPREVGRKQLTAAAGLTTQSGAAPPARPCRELVSGGRSLSWKCPAPGENRAGPKTGEITRTGCRMQQLGAPQRRWGSGLRGGWCPGCDSRGHTERDRETGGQRRGGEGRAVVPGTHPALPAPPRPHQPRTIRLQDTPGQGCGASARDRGGVRGRRQAAAPPWALHPVTQEFPGRRDVGRCPAPPALEPAPAREEPGGNESGPAGPSGCRRHRGQESFPPGLSPRGGRLARRPAPLAGGPRR